MTKETTLFSHYKKMINCIWEAGQRKYTADQLNTFVGMHEKTTSWKRCNNNPYYTTRCYQTALKQLGCITKIKRGLWEINGPMPQWFGSFHIKGLKGGFDINNKYADHSCIYWSYLPSEHKINPWKGIVDARIDARRTILLASSEAYECEQVTLRRGESITAPTAPVLGFSNTTVDPGMISTTIRYRVTTSFGQELACTSWVNLFAVKDDAWDGQVDDTEITLVSNPQAKYADILNVLNVLQGVEATKEFLKSLDKFALSEALKAYPAIPTILGKPEEPKAVVAVGAKTYTLAEVERILSAYTEFIVEDLSIEDIFSNVDADDVVELDWDNYNKSMHVHLDTNSLHSAVADGIVDNIKICNNNFDITEVELL